MNRVLVVDDTATSLELMLYLLRAFGYEPAGFSNPQAALDSAGTQPYDLALVDILMPEMDGFEFARRMRADPRTAAIPLIAVTALAMVGDRERVLQSGFDGYISKPIDPQNFGAQIEAFRNAQQRRELVPQPTGPLILVVDDIAVNRQVIVGTLAPFGYRIAQAAEASQAVRQIAHERPALILCDVHMPGGGGFELVEHVKNDPGLADIPFVFISSTAWQTADKRRALELGAQQFILRPIDPQHLLDIVQKAVGTTNGNGSRC